MRFLAAVLVGLLTGVLSGFGVGGGTLLLLWLTLTQGIPQQQAAGVNLLYFTGCAIPALLGHRKSGMVEKSAAKWAAISGLPLCVLGAIAATLFDTTLLRRLFGGFLLVVGWRELCAKKPAHTAKKTAQNTKRPKFKP